MILGYWKIRGLYSPIIYMLKYLKVDYEEIQYDQGDGPEFSREDWYKVKFTIGYDFPNLPYLQDDELKITETPAILRHIARKFGSPEFNGKSVKDKANIDMVYGLVSDIRYDTMVHCYLTGDIEGAR